VWADQDTHNKVYTDAKGLASLPLSVGSHTVTFEAAGKTFQRTMQIVAPRTQRLPVNVARELRLGGGADIEVNVSPLGEENALEIAAEPTSPRTRTATPRQNALAHTAAAVVAPPFQLDEPNEPAPTNEAPRAEPTLLLGRYRITAQLGRGAMGIVHRASDEKLEREVAIKEMSEELRAHPVAMQMFTQEAKALAQLNHTNIVAMYDQVDDGARVLLIMEFVDGRTLESVLAERGALPWFEAIGICDQVCAGLAYAHARKVIHRDIKPANIFIAQDRTVKLGDFGLARVMREVSIRKTEIRGTPLYMAPEQISGENVDHRADLYALGAMLYEMMCGEPPFHTGDVLYHQVHTPAPFARALKPDLPPAIDELIQKLMAKSANDRLGSAQEIRAAFRALSSY
jgi:serine/threonine-protein kinase